MIGTLTRYGDFIAAIGFGIALLVVMVTPAERGGLFVRSVKYTVAGVLAIFLFLTGMDASGETHLAGIADLYEDYAQTLPAVLALGAAYALYSTQQYHDIVRAHRALAQSHDLMMDVVDEVAAGILLLDPSGKIAFANETAKGILDLEDRADGTVRGPGWVVEGDGAGRPDCLLPLVQDEAFQGKRLRLDWPSGWHVELRASGRPLSDANDRLGGVVVMFERA